MKAQQQRVTIGGGGPVGTLMAIFLAKKGIEVDLYEKRGDPRLEKQAEGRSINLALSLRGLSALKEAGIEAQLLSYAIPMKGRLVHTINDAPPTHFIPYSLNQNNVIYSIRRFELNKLILEQAAAYPNINFHFNEECLGIDLKAHTIQFKNKKNHRIHTEPFSILFDSEGLWSPIRSSLLNIPYTNFSQQYIEFDYKELTIPALNLNGGYAIEKNAFHLWPRTTHLMIALPNPDGSFTCTLFLPHKGNHSFDSFKNVAAASDFLQREFPDALALSKQMPEQLVKHPTGRLATVTITPWSFGERILLIGDAAHGIVPFYGQGLNCGFEDCSFLNHCISQYPGDWKQIFATYENERRKNTEAIAQLSMDNFLELRKTAADPIFKLKRELETLLEQKYPGEFLSKYSMVTFSQIPYEEALKKGRRQDRLLMDACSKVQSLSELNLDKIAQSLRST